jgi:uncharacterized membrane protein affecting hemolysin expression
VRIAGVRTVLLLLMIMMLVMVAVMIMMAVMNEERRCGNQVEWNSDFSDRQSEREREREQPW